MTVQVCPSCSRFVPRYFATEHRDTLAGCPNCAAALQIDSEGNIVNTLEQAITAPAVDVPDTPAALTDPADDDAGAGHDDEDRAVPSPPSPPPTPTLEPQPDNPAVFGINDAVAPFFASPADAPGPAPRIGSSARDVVAPTPRTLPIESESLESQLWGADSAASQQESEPSVFEAQVERSEDATDSGNGPDDSPSDAFAEPSGLLGLGGDQDELADDDAFGDRLDAYLDMAEEQSKASIGVDTGDPAPAAPAQSLPDDASADGGPAIGDAGTNDPTAEASEAVDLAAIFDAATDAVADERVAPTDAASIGGAAAQPLGHAAPPAADAPQPAVTAKQTGKARPSPLAAITVASPPEALDEIEIVEIGSNGLVRESLRRLNARTAAAANNDSVKDAPLGVRPLAPPPAVVRSTTSVAAASDHSARGRQSLVGGIAGAVAGFVVRRDWRSALVAAAAGAAAGLGTGSDTRHQDGNDVGSGS